MKILNHSDLKAEKTLLQNGSVEVRFTRNEIPCPLYEFKDKRAKICNINQLTIKDFETLIHTAALAEKILNLPDVSKVAIFSPENDNQMIISCLLNTIVVTYSKITTSSGLRGKENLFLQHIKKHLTAEELMLHRKIKHMRDKWLAHLDENPYETAKTILVFDPSNESLPILGHHLSYKTISVEANFFAEFRNLAIKILTILKQKQNTDKAAFTFDEIKNLAPTLRPLATDYLIYHKPD
ncbi:hypothetical protein G7011_02795 [Pseudomonas plecoglossicida]|uniref:hypothetical protein n=1 Tax=Pseudomonas plecoglossicida TaxID=70775 RepID=UPI0015E33B99|nr:hypothetical protein [Pseudomonas plecoglossicida]MBA1196029.1 hypothetical protein [Pseudomonas plecoglossicida]